MNAYQTFLHSLQKMPVVAVLRAPSESQALRAIECCLQAGLSHIEVTFSTPRTAFVISEAKKKFPHIIVGAGTVLTVAQAQEALAAGAEFIISPHSDEALIQWAVREKICYIPGAATPTELMHIYKQGCQVQKLFPGSLYGAQGVRTLLQPLPQLNVIVTGGVAKETAKDFLAAGAKAVCVGSQLFQEKWWKSSDWAALQKEAEAWTKALT